MQNIIQYIFIHNQVGIELHNGLGSCYMLIFIIKV